MKLWFPSLLIGLSICCVTAFPAEPASSNKPVHGAIYVSYEAYNAPQMWKNFNLAETRRDFGYAQKLHLNALRIWASYEYWKLEPAKFEASLDQMLSAAQESGMGVLLALFENDGVPPTVENMWTTDPQKAYCIQSPGRDIASVDHKEQWDAPRAFIQWFMKKYANDSRLIGIEVMNEPGPATIDFAKSMFTTAHSMHGKVPLTIGSARLATAMQFLPLGENLIEFHQNFPPDVETIDKEIQAAMDAGKQAGVPVWLTEWQRIRTSGSGFNAKVIDPKEASIDYASLASEVKKYSIGTSSGH